jgi:hypothetical protein
MTRSIKNNAKTQYIPQYPAKTPCKTIICKIKLRPYCTKKCSFYRFLNLNEDKEEKIEGVAGFLFNVPLK